MIKIIFPLTASMAASFALSGCDASSSHVSASDHPTSSSAAAPSTETAKSEIPPVRWTYDTAIDGMRGTKRKLATALSDERFPDIFGRATSPTELVVQKEGKQISVYIHNKNLQFTCNSFTNTQVAVKFDNGPVVHYGCSDAKGDAYGVAFINPGGKFAARLKMAKRVIVEAEVFQHGDVQQTFSIEGFAM